MTEKLYGIDNTKKIIDNFGDLLCAIIGLAKGGIGLGSVRKIGAVIAELRNIAVAVKPALPELGDLDSEEKTELLKCLTDMLTKLAETALE